MKDVSNVLNIFFKTSPDYCFQTDFEKSEPILESSD